MAEGRIEKLNNRVEIERERYQDRGRIFRVAWVCAAATVVAAGLAMVVFPGPAVIVIPIGLLMLSLEFAWAQRVLDKGLEGGQAAVDLAGRASRRQKVLAVAAAACAALAVSILAAVILL